MTIDQQNLWPNPGMTTSAVTARASAVLPAAGAYDAAPTEFATASIQYVTFYITYTRGAAGGDMQFKIEVSPYYADLPVVEDWFQLTCNACGTITSGQDAVGGVQRSIVEYGSTSANAECFIYGPVELEGTTERMRIACRESGQPNTPGTCHIVALMS